MEKPVIDRVNTGRPGDIYVAIFVHLNSKGFSVCSEMLTVAVEMYCLGTL